MLEKRHRRDGQHDHDPEQPAELRDVVVMTAMARMAVFRVVGVPLVLRVVHLRHAITIPLRGIWPVPEVRRGAYRCRRR